jgi:hypothetical protein
MEASGEQDVSTCSYCWPRWDGEPFVATPPHELLARYDHVALAAWYENEAVRLHQKAKEMDQIQWRNTGELQNEHNA